MNTFKISFSIIDKILQIDDSIDTHLVTVQDKKNITY